MALYDWLGKFFTQDEKDDKKTLSNQIASENQDGAVEVSDNALSYVTDLDFGYSDEVEMINNYRQIANYNEVDYAIEDIVNEMVNFSEDSAPVELDLTEADISDNIKERIQEKYDKIIKLLDLKNSVHTKAKQFYIDGRLAYQKVINKSSAKQGLQRIIPLDVINITKIRKVDYDEQTQTIRDIKEYFIYNEERDTKKRATDSKSQKRQPMQLHPDSITYVTTGMIDPTNGYAIGYLHKAVKPANQLRMMENALVIYRITRAPERRVFYVDTGNLPRNKAQQYMKKLSQSVKNRMSYNPDTGDLKDTKHHQTMQEDFWFPRNSNGRGTQVDTLPGGQNLGDIEDVVYFQKRLYKALNVPVSRLESDAMLQFGRATEINRDELKFSKFVSKIRKRFNMALLDLLKTELVLTKVMTEKEWDDIVDDVQFQYAQDMYLEEQKKFEMMRDRLELHRDIQPMIGLYYSHDYIRQEILKQTDEDIKEMDKQIKKEQSDPRYKVEEPDSFAGQSGF